MTVLDPAGKHLHFVTGRLAQHALEAQVSELAQQLSFEYSIDVMPITVAALMTSEWLALRIQVPDNADLILLPGYCGSDLSPLESITSVPLMRGPKDLRRLPHFFGQTRQADSYGQYDIEILAEINHAPRMAPSAILSEARQLKADGADIVDVGCEPGHSWNGVSDCVRMLKDEGLRVSIDSLDPTEIAAAAAAGAELVLSVNSSNRTAALDWGCEVVVIPDDPESLAGLDETVDFLADQGVPLRIDPILEPIGLGFANSLQRYHQTRMRYPDAEMLMGIGNLTELTDVDSAGVNVILLGICQELGIRSVLTTQVIPWARSSVKECHLARQLVYHAVDQGIPPKHMEDDLVMLRDPTTTRLGKEALEELAKSLKDPNYRIYAEGGELHLLSAGLHLSDEDPFRLFERLAGGEGQPQPPGNLDASHCFYLGFELAKAVVALELDKQYTQDESLDWGFLSKHENWHRLQRSPRQRHEG